MAISGRDFKTLAGKLTGILLTGFIFSNRIFVMFGPGFLLIKTRMQLHHFAPRYYNLHLKDHSY